MLIVIRSSPKYYSPPQSDFWVTFSINQYPENSHLLLGTEKLSVVKTLQKDLPLSQSFIWNLQTEYYKSLGINAWLSGTVPSLVTTNSHLAWRYARLIASYIRDTQAKRVTIVELGAGHGRFGFLTASHLKKLAADLIPAETTWRYILTDCAERNLHFYESHQAFDNLRRDGNVDFACYEAGIESGITLRCSGDVIDADHPVEHLIVIGNYFFDSLPMDVWHVENNQLSAFWPIIKVQDTAEAFTVENPEVLDQLELGWEWREQKVNYPSQNWNRISEQLASEIRDGTFMLPTGGLGCLEQIQSWTSHPMFLLVTDKGYPQVEDYRDRGPPTLIQHGCFSFNLNFVALQKWFEEKSGVAFMPKCRDGLIETAAFTTQLSRECLPLTTLEYSALAQFTPAEYHQVTRRCEKANPDLFTALSYLKLSCYDPVILHRLRKCIRAGISGADSIDRKLLYEVLSKVRENFFHLHDLDIPFDIGLIYQHLGDHSIAISLFNESLQLFGEKAITFYNLAICYEKLGQTEKALFCIEKSIALEPDHDALDFQRKIKVAGLS